MKTANGSIYRGVVWPGTTAYPDWFNDKTQAYWNGQFGSFFNESTGVDIDALWIDMKASLQSLDSLVRWFSPMQPRLRGQF
jgi:alpha-glucosidase (family GH31 glycosyl hydrolase)